LSGETKFDEIGEIQGEVVRVRIPQEEKGEVLGVAEKMLGGSRILVLCVDGVRRMCRIPGRLKKRNWIHLGDIVIVVPWDFQNEKADVVHKYTRPQAVWLEKRGYLK
jgi:translation initiation factor 1A